MAEVEWAFRTMKTVMLETRGIFVRLARRTRAHVFVVMLAYMLIYQLRRCWVDIEATVEEGLKDLGDVCAIKKIRDEKTICQTIPSPRLLGRKCLQAVGVTLPDAIPCREIAVVTRKKLVSERKVA